MAYPTLAERHAASLTTGLPRLPGITLPPFIKPIGFRKVGDRKMMHGAPYEWTGNYWKCLDVSKRTFTVVRKIKGIEAKKKALEEQLDLKPGSGMSYKAMTEALAAGGMEAWRKALEAKLPIPKVRVPTITPDVTVAVTEGKFEVVAGQGIRDTATGKIIAYIGANNQLMDIHGTVIGSYVGDRKTVTSVSLATFKAVPVREGIPYCEEKNYEKAKKYLIDLMDKGLVPGGSTLVQRHNQWVYIPPKPENETMKLDTGEWIYKLEYDKLPANVQDYLHKYGIAEFIETYIPAQEWVAADIKRQLKPYEIRGTVPPEGIVNPEFVKYIQSLKGYDWIGALQGGVSPRIIKQFFEELPKGIVNPAFVKYMREGAYIDSIVAAIQSGVDHKKLIEIFGKKKYATAKIQCGEEEREARKEAPPTIAGLSHLPAGQRVKTSLKAMVTEPFFTMNELGDSVGNIIEFSKQQPTNVVTMPYKIATGALVGVSMIMVMPAMLWALLATPPGERVEAAKKIGKGTVEFFATLPIMFKADPYFTSGMIAGMILGPKGVLRTAKTSRVWTDPYGVPARTIGIEFSTGRAMIGKLSQADLGRLMDMAQRQILEGKLSGTLVIKGVKVKYRGSPIQQTVGEILFSATPDATSFVKPGIVHIKAGGLYTSVSTPARFMAGGATGTIPIKYPAVIAFMTDVAKIQRIPGHILGRATQSDWYIRQAHEGFHSPSKIYRHAFESEVVAAKGTAVTHAPKTLRSRIFGTKAGDFFTQYTGADAVVGTTKITKGQLVPLIFMLDKGVFRTPPSPALMYATKLLTIKETLLDFKQALKHPLRTSKDIVKFRIGPKGVREFEVYSVKEVASLATKLKEAARKMADKLAKEEGYAYPEAYRMALVRAYEAHRARIYRLASGVLERAYEANPRIYEELYRYNLERNLRAATRAYSTAQARYDVDRGVERRLPKVDRYAVPRLDDRDYARRGIAETRTPRVPRRDLPRVRLPRYVPPKVYRIRPAITVPRIIPVPHKRLILLPSGESVRLTKKQWEGIIAWKQGFMYKMIYPPYGVKDIVNSRKTLAGVKYYSGADSAYKSVLAKGGVVPREVLRDMGIMDLRFRTTRPTSKKPKLFYKRDIKQRTKTTPTTPGIMKMK